MGVSELRRLKQLEDEIGKLKRQRKDRVWVRARRQVRMLSASILPWVQNRHVCQVCASADRDHIKYL